MAKFQHLEMNLSDKLLCVWEVWLSYSSDNAQGQMANYDSNLNKICTIENWADLCYIWKTTELSDPSNFFIDPLSGKFTKYEINGGMKKVQSINLFKKDIEPRWEDPHNAKGGYFNFSLPKQTASQEIQALYQNLLFLVLGATHKICEYVNGFRIVDTTLKNKFQCRIEIWLNYKYDDENLEKIGQHGRQIHEVMKKLGMNFTLKFYNIGEKLSVQIGEELVSGKEKKKEEMKKSEEYMIKEQ